MDTTTESYAEKRCVQLRNQYDASQLRARRWHHSMNTIAIASTVFAPVVVLVVRTDSDLNKIVVALVAAVGGLCTGVSSHFKWHEVWLRHARTAAALSAELTRFKSRADPYANAQKAEATFALNIERIENGSVEEFLRNHGGKPQDASGDRSQPSLASQTG